MQKKSDDFSVGEAMRLAGTPAGQQLLSMLQTAHGDQLQQVIRQANAGNLQQASQLLNSMLSSSQAQALLRQMEND